MPIYEYHCEKCDKTFEELVRSGETPVCPQCGSDALRRKVSVPSRPHTSAGSSCPAREAGVCEPHHHGPGCGCCGCHE